MSAPDKLWDEYFYEIEIFAMRMERFHEDMNHVFKDGDTLESRQMIIRWLRGAFDAGFEAGEKHAR